MSEPAVFTIHPAVPGDTTAFHSLHTASVTTLCVTHYPAALIERWIERRTPEGYLPGIERGEMFVCEHGGQMVGFGHAVRGEVVGLFVHPEWAGQGAGKCLLAHALERARQGHAGPVTVLSTLNAEGFYARHGFCTVQRTAVQRNGVDVGVVEMRLDPPG